MKRYNFYLLISGLIIFIVGVTYGLSPAKTLPSLVDIPIVSIDSRHMLSAVMGLYIGFAFYWLYSAQWPQYWHTATCSVILFMAALAFGRIISIVYDGKPSQAFIIGLFVEITLAICGIIQLKKEKK